MRLFPSKSARPDRTRPLRASRPSTASEVTLFPQPDSPTMPRVSPGAIAKEIPFTACTMPRRVVNSTWRSSTWRSGALALTQLRIQRFAEAVPDQVEAENGKDDRHTWNDRQEGRCLQVVVHVREHRAPLRCCRILRSEPEKAQARNIDDRRCHCQRPLHDHR